jgi:hypothetical protein
MMIIFVGTMKSIMQIGEGVIKILLEATETRVEEMVKRIVKSGLV